MTVAGVREVEITLYFEAVERLGDGSEERESDD
jgi:hypothetical protein